MAEITLPGRRRKLVTATGYSPTSDSGESNLGTSFVMQNAEMQNAKFKIQDLKYSMKKTNTATGYSPNLSTIQKHTRATYALYSPEGANCKMTKIFGKSPTPASQSLQTS